MNVMITADYQQLSNVAARHVAAVLLKKPEAILGLATGSTPIGLYEELVRFYEEGLISFKEAKSFNLDEYRGLAPDHPESYRFFMEKHLFSKVDMVPENTHVMDGMAEEPTAECQAYEEAIRQSGGIDIMVLGIGVNSHIAFNEPEDTFSNSCRLVGLSESTISANARFFPTREEVPTQALSMGVGSIMRCKKILLLASGKNKAEAIYHTLKGEVDPRYPSSILQFHPDVTLIIDQEAASLLP